MNKYNKNAKYKAGFQSNNLGHLNDDKMAFDLQNLIRPNIYTSNSTYFKTSYKDILQQNEVSVPYIEVFFNKFTFGPKE